jgi:signal transduction histidine kinase
VRNLAERRPREWLSPAYRALIPALFGLGLLALQPQGPGCGPILLAALAAAALVLALLPIHLPGQAPPMRVLPLALIPAWLLCGAWVTAGLFLVVEGAVCVLRDPRRRPATRPLAASLLGTGMGAALGSLGAAPLPAGISGETARALGFALGLWLGQYAVDWADVRRVAVSPSWLVQLLTNLALVPPGIFLAEIGAADDPIPFLASLGLAVALAILVRASTNSETRTAEFAVQAANSADARTHLELIVDQAPEAILGMDMDGKVRWLNRTAAEWLGDRAGEVVGQAARTAVALRTPHGGQLDHARLLARAAEEGRPLHEEGLLEGAAGAPERVLASYSAAGDPASADLGLVLLRDASVVTESLREQEELAVHLSHELRAPLTTILGYAQLMANPHGSEAVADPRTEFARRISESGDYMLRLVNNLLDLGQLARDEVGRLPTERIDAATITREVVEAHRVQAGERAQELSVTAPSGPLYLETAELALRQILTNLVANAIKYTPANGHIRVELLGEAEAVVWKVVDDGIGLSPDEQAKLFGKFFRSQRPEARLTKGTGLGLALTKALIERLGGSIEVRSAVDQGSTFTVRLPR